MLEIVLNFDLPYPLFVEGRYPVRAGGENFIVSLHTHFENEPRIPGVESAENISLVHEDTNILAHTNVEAQFTSSDAELAWNQPRLYTELNRLSIALANVLIAGVRVEFNEHVLEFVYQPQRVGPIVYRILNVPKGAIVGGVCDPLMGGITSRKPTRTSTALIPFAQRIAEGAMPSVGEELYLDARRYLIRGNFRMALANLAISLEVRLSDALAAVALANGDLALEADVRKATLATLGQDCAKRALGFSLENAALAGIQACTAFRWLRIVRNEVLHKANMPVTFLWGSAALSTNKSARAAIADSRAEAAPEVATARMTRSASSIATR